jgi:3-phosphoshikimate 1-carboxyvinyltransferase
LEGACSVPGDKSISHRAALLGALAEGATAIENFLCGADCLSTLRCLRGLGIVVEQKGGWITIGGRGRSGLTEPEDVLDAGNSGTTMRLLLGILAGQDFFAVLTGDDSLRRRPMGRVIQPLQQMGARIWGRDSGFKAPLAIRGQSRLLPLSYQLPMPSAQVKSAILLAGLYASGTTTVLQPVTCRDHTERMLQAFGASIRIDPDNSVHLDGGGSLHGQTVKVPGDISAAAFLMVAATLMPGSDLLIRDVGINPTRTGIIEVLGEMGADIQLLNERCWSGEPVADIRVRSAGLRGVTISGATIPRLIDEIPVLAVAAAAAAGETRISDAAELRVKETDRIAALVCELQKFGVDLEALPDGMVIRGGRPLTGAPVNSWGDHRLAMSLVVAGLTAGVDKTVVDDAGCIAVSFPGFTETLRSLGARVEPAGDWPS